MDFTPGERAVLNQLRELYAKSSARDHPLTRITALWPSIHYEAYRKALADLLKKGLLDNPNNGQALTITDDGLKAMGFGAPTAPRRAKAVGAKASRRPEKRKAAPAKPASRRPALGVVGGLGLLAAFAGVGWLLWRAF